MLHIDPAVLNSCTPQDKAIPLLSTNQQSQLHTLLGAMKKNLQKQEEMS